MDAGAPVRRACRAGILVLGRSAEDRDAYPPLRGLAPFAVSGKRALWHFVPGAAFRSQYCGGTPKATEQEGQDRNADQYQRQQIVSQHRALQQPGIRGFIHQEAGGRCTEERAATCQAVLW